MIFVAKPRVHHPKLPVNEIGLTRRDYEGPVSTLCAGCGHGIVLGTLIRSIHSLEIPKDDVVIVAGIGCSRRLAVYVDFNTVHTTHGRAIPFATGLALSRPDSKVVVYSGDGDLSAIGGNHLIQRASKGRFGPADFPHQDFPGDAATFIKGIFRS